MVTTETRIKALAKYLGIRPKEIKESTYGEGLEFETKEDGSFLVLTYDEAYDKAVEDIKGLMDDLGLEAFPEWARDYIIDNFIDTDYLYDALYDDLYDSCFTQMDGSEIEEYCQDLGIEYKGDDTDFVDLVNAYIEHFGYDEDPASYFTQFFNDKEFYKFVIDNGYLDEDAICDWVIREDGMAPHLAIYDGNEIELNNDLYAYKTNN